MTVYGHDVIADTSLPLDRLLDKAVSEIATFAMLVQKFGGKFGFEKTEIDGCVTRIMLIGQFPGDADHDAFRRAMYDRPPST